MPIDSAKPLPWTVSDCLAATGGELVGSASDTQFSGIGIDSRAISPSELFVAIRGEVHDGHRFAADVVAKGVRGLLLARDRLPDLPLRDWVGGGVSCIAVDDTIGALGALATYHRDRNRVAVTAITGSNGKTTTRQMTASVVSQRFDTLSTKKNFNNNIGLPLTLLELCPKHRWAVVELGMNAPGEIDLLARICKPDIGVITNVGPAHLEGVGTIEGVMRAKGELLGRIRSGGTAVLNFDDERVRRLGEQAACRVMFYGLSASAAVRAEALEAVDGGTRFTLRLPDGTGERVLLNLPGQFMVVNALAAAAVGCLVGLSPSDIRAGLEHFEPVAGRMNISIIGTGIHLIDDTYNANPASMAAALTTLAALRKDRRSFAVLGDMRELGDHADALHRELGVIAAESGLQVLFVCGEFAEAVARGALEAGMAPDKVIAGDKAHLLKCLIERLKPDDWVLVKGSRAMAMEETVSGLRAWAKTLS